MLNDKTYKLEHEISQIQFIVFVPRVYLGSIIPKPWNEKKFDHNEQDGNLDEEDQGDLSENGCVSSPDNVIFHIIFLIAITFVKSIHRQTVIIWIKMEMLAWTCVLMRVNWSGGIDRDLRFTNLIEHSSIVIVVKLAYIGASLSCVWILCQLESVFFILFLIIFILKQITFLLFESMSFL